MTPLRCWWINHYAVPPVEAGGTRHFSLARNLLDHDVNVLLIRSNTNYFRQEAVGLQAEAIELLHHDGVEFAKLKSPKYQGNTVSKLLNMIAFKRELRRSYAKLPGPTPDVIIGSSPHPFAADGARRIARRLGVPFVYEVRDLWPRTLVDVGGMSPLHPLVLWFGVLERRLCRAADRVFTLLPDSHAHFESLGVPRSRILHIPNGIDADMVVRTIPSGRPSAFRIMFIGLHGLVYGLDTILDAAAVLQSTPEAPAIEWVLLGDGPEKSRLMKRAADEGLRNVIFQDSVPKGEVYKAAGDAHAFIMLARRSEIHKSGLSPNKLYDYMAMGRPIIYAVDGSSNIVERSGVGVTIPPEDSQALAKAAVQMAGMPNEDRRKMGDRGIEYVKTHHDLSVLAGTVAEALREVTGRSGAAEAIGG